MINMILRDVIADDLPIFFEHQLDPEATEMAAFPPRTREAFMAHWARLLADPTLIKLLSRCWQYVCWLLDWQTLVGSGHCHPGTHGISATDCCTPIVCICCQTQSGIAARATEMWLHDL